MVKLLVQCLIILFFFLFWIKKKDKQILSMDQYKMPSFDLVCLLCYQKQKIKSVYKIIETSHKEHRMKEGLIN